MELEEMLLEMEPENPKMKVTTETTKVETTDMEAMKISDLRDLINSVPDGVIISVRMEVMCHD